MSDDGWVSLAKDDGNVRFCLCQFYFTLLKMTT
jgi:hypothetical protein